MKKTETVRLKIFLFIYSLSSGGAERVAVTLANFWAARGWSVSIITIAGIENDFYEIHPDIRRIVLHLDTNSSNVLLALKSNIVRIRSLRRILVEQNPDVALGFISTSNSILAIAVQGLRIATIGSEQIHPPALPLGRIWSIIRRITYPNLSVVSALTELSADWIQQIHPPGRFQLFPTQLVFLCLIMNRVFLHPQCWRTLTHVTRF